MEIIRGRAELVQEFIDYQIRLFFENEAGHGQPFYYHFDSNRQKFSFASEPKSFRKISLDMQINEPILLAYLTLNMVSHPVDPFQTFFKFLMYQNV